jgi:hypothetical protein
MTAGGDCFESALMFLALLDTEVEAGIFLVHGVVRHPDSGLRHVHAWVERHEDGRAPEVIDHANGLRYEGSAVTYYAIGGITQTVKYTPREARRLAVETEHFGPWDAALNRVQDEAVRTLTEENHGR